MRPGYTSADRKPDRLGRTHRFPAGFDQLCAVMEQCSEEPGGCQACSVRAECEAWFGHYACSNASELNIGKSQAKRWSQANHEFEEIRKRKNIHLFARAYEKGG